MEKKRLSKALAAAGIASRRACEELIFSGKVLVNGKVCLIPQTPVCLKTDEVRYDGRRIFDEEKKVYYILNKPNGYICSNKRVGTKKIVLDLFLPTTERLFTIGRLDRDTSGLLLVTNDGHFAHRVIHPSSNIGKEYLVKVAQEVMPEHLIAISRGANVEGKWVKPIKVVKVRKSTIKVVVKEGKKREVRIFVERAGLSIRELTRIRIGGLVLGTLPEGAWRELTEKEKTLIFNETMPKEKKQSEQKPFEL